MQAQQDAGNQPAQRPVKMRVDNDRSAGHVHGDRAAREPRDRRAHQRRRRLRDDRAQARPQRRLGVDGGRVKQRQSGVRLADEQRDLGAT